MKQKSPPYKILEKLFAKLNHLEQAQAVLNWDAATNMPSGGAEARAEQLATLKSLHHAILSDKGVEDLLEQAKSNEKKLSGWQRSNLAEMNRIFKHTTVVPQKLLKEFSKAGSHCEMEWREARAANDFKRLSKPLKKVVDLVREISTIKGEAFGCDPYDALLDQYDPGRKSSQIDTIFEDLREFLPGFIQQVLDKQAADKPVVPLKGPFPIDKQKELSHRMLEIIGFDQSRGRIDESHHPFCGGYPSDIRITTRYDENDFTSSLMAVMHEAGHAMYEAGLPQGWGHQPVGQARGMSVHESQSLIIEMQACRSKAFLSFVTPHLKEVFDVKGRGWSANNLYRHYTKVEPSLIRVDADEVTYPAHILLRYYTEKYLVSGDMEVTDLPEAWAQGMERFLNIKPDNDTNGCMQDIHWMDGSFGYFPTYTIGAIYAAQLFDSAKRANGDIESALEKGDFSPLKSWLTEHIHDKGSRFETDNLIKHATGSSLDVEAYKHHLKTRYLDA